MTEQEFNEFDIALDRIHVLLMATEDQALPEMKSVQKRILSLKVALQAYFLNKSNLEAAKNLKAEALTESRRMVELGSGL